RQIGFIGQKIRVLGNQGHIVVGQPDVTMVLHKIVKVLVYGSFLTWGCGFDSRCRQGARGTPHKLRTTTARNALPSTLNTGVVAYGKQVYTCTHESYLIASALSGNKWSNPAQFLRGRSSS